MFNYNDFINEKNDIFKKISNDYAKYLNVKIIQLFDSGLNGSAYKTNNDTVIKITPSFEEADIVYNLIKNNKNLHNKHVAEYYDIKKYSIGDDIYFAIHIELLDTDCKIKELFELLKVKIYLYNKIYYDKYASYYNADSLRDLYRDIKNTINSELRNFILQLIDLIEELDRLNIPNEDLHAGNLGYKNNRLAIFDLLNKGKKSHLPYKCDVIL